MLGGWLLLNWFVLYEFMICFALYELPSFALYELPSFALYELPSFALEFI